MPWPFDSRRRIHCGKRQPLRSCHVRERVVIIVVLSLLGVAGCSSSAATQSDVVRPVKTMVVASGEQPQVRSFPGRVEASKRVELAFQVPGLLTQFPVREGQSIAKGELIGQLRQDEFQARLTTLQGQLDQARAVLRRCKRASPEERLRREAQVRAAEARLANARADYERFARLLPSRAVAQADYDLAASTYRIAQEDHKAAIQLLEQASIAREEDIDAQEAAVRGLEGRVVEANIQLQDTTLLRTVRRRDRPAVRRTGTERASQAARRAVSGRRRDRNRRRRAGERHGRRHSHGRHRADGRPRSAAPRACSSRSHIKEVAQVADPTTQTFAVRVPMQGADRL